MPSTHEIPIEIGFKHCDPAGIVFYPRYVEMLNDVVEHWFNHGLEISFNTLHLERRLGMPLVDLQVGFQAPSRLGDMLTGRLSVDHIGRTSLKLCVRLCGPDDSVRVEAKLVVVFIALDTARPIEIPDDIRKAIERAVA